jgi:hypothetical protein
MKSLTVVNILRCILILYVVREAWLFLHGIILGITPFQASQLAVSAALFVIYAAILFALLFRPESSAKLVFGALTGMALLSLVPVVIWLVIDHLTPGAHIRLVGTDFIISVGGAFCAAVIAYFHYRIILSSQTTM